MACTPPPPTWPCLLCADNEGAEQARNQGKRSSDADDAALPLLQQAAVNTASKRRKSGSGAAMPRAVLGERDLNAATQVHSQVGERSGNMADVITMMPRHHPYWLAWALTQTALLHHSALLLAHTLPSHIMHVVLHTMNSG